MVFDGGFLFEEIAESGVEVAEGIVVVVVVGGSGVVATKPAHWTSCTRIVFLLMVEWLGYGEDYHTYYTM